MHYLIIILGFVALTFGANYLVDGASALARRFHVSDLVVGLTVVAFGTSAPELVVNIVAAIEGTSEIAFTNVLGSNSINAFIILGISALIFPLAAQKSSIKFDIPLSVLAGVAVLVLAGDFIGTPSFRGLSRGDALIMLVVFSMFLYHSIKMSRVPAEVPAGADSGQSPVVKPIMSLGLALMQVGGGLAALVLGGNMIVKSAVALAASWGVSESIVGVTIVAFGTSLPELATSAMAAAKKNTDIAIGNVIGSNIFNVFLILGVSALIRPMPVYANLVMDSLMASLGCFMVWMFTGLGNKHCITRWQGLLMLAVYGVYLYRLIGRL